MQKVLTAEEMREVDRQTTEKYGIPSIILMENAAHAAARIITEKLGGSVEGKSFLILCGKGSNGGDGAALARILWTQGADVDVYLFGKVSETKGDAKTNFEIIKKIGEREYPSSPYLLFYENEEIDQTTKVQFLRNDVIIDAVFGTGLTRPIDKTLSDLFYFFECQKNIREKNPLFVSIDIPSGLNADSSNEFKNCFKADLTVTFTLAKPANVLAPNYKSNGELFIENIGSPYELKEKAESQLFISEEFDARYWLKLTKFTSDSYKNKRGHALLIVGSREYTGAAVLAGNSAMISGVGLTSVATSESAQTAIAAKVYEEIITLSLPETKNGAIAKKAFENIEKLTEKVDVAGIGCGLSSTEKTTKDFVREVLTKRKTPIVIDADGLNALAPFELEGSSELPLILTPHEGEFLRLLGTENKDRIKDRVKAVRDFAEEHKVILVLKGERVLIGAPDNRVVINPTGNSGLGKAGNGDTLTGIITGFVAQAVRMKVDIFETVVAAVYISGLASDIAAEKFGKRAMLASDVRECLGAAFAKLEKSFENLPANRRE